MRRTQRGDPSQPDLFAALETVPAAAPPSKRQAAATAARVYTIPAGVGFVDALARGILDAHGQDPLALSGAMVLLPTRRACRSLQEAFLRLSEGRALLLPRLFPLGDLDPDDPALLAAELPADMQAAAELPPAIPPLRRQLLLTRLILAGPARGAEKPTPDQAARLAAELARFLDQVQTEQIGFERLQDLVPADLAIHWQQTVRFLEILTLRWPEMLKAEGCTDPAERRNALLQGYAAAWTAEPPQYPVIAAGSTGSIPATAALLQAVSHLPQGAVVLPGLDQDADEASWAEIIVTPTHPQHGLALLLNRLGLPRSEVELWPAAAPQRQRLAGVPATAPARARLVQAALRPAGASQTAVQELDRAEAEAGAHGVTRIDCAGPQQEAGAIALLMRECLEAPGKRAALVTPDRLLARRVAAELRRWDIAVDDSGGRPLADTPPGTFLLLTAQLFAERVAPVALLSVLKHPLAGCGMPLAALRRRTRKLERRLLRGPRPAPGFAGLLLALAELKEAPRAELEPWLRRLADMAAPLAAAMAEPIVGFQRILEMHVGFAEGLARTHEQSGAARLWAGEAGEAAANFVADLAQAAAGFGALAGADYPALLEALLAGQVVRPRFGLHPRLAIWGPLEARLQRPDLLILGGLNEGTWPPEPGADPWMSRPMRQAFGLPAPERRIGLSAHDFVQAFCAPEVVLTRALRVEGTPTVPSRWLMRLAGSLEGLKVMLGPDRAEAFLGWQSRLDVAETYRPCPSPAPKPPVAHRPRQLSVTRIETWMRDPYSLYARSVLDLRRLDDLDADPGALERGQCIHAALDCFVRENPGPLPDDALDRLLQIGRDTFGAVLERPSVWAFWWPRFERIARWFLDVEAKRRTEVQRSLTEVRGALALEAPGGPFTLTATADRFDLLADGSVAILDYKTGSVPTKGEITAGFAPQLPLEAGIAMRGGFAEVGTPRIAEIAYWRLSGGAPAGKICDIEGDPEDRAERALAGFENLVRRFDEPETPYPSHPDPRFAPKFGDYDHLARLKEWSAGVAPSDE